MTINTSQEAIRVACAQATNDVGTCQANVHMWFNAPSAGDFDHDGDADAVDGWESEPKAYRIVGNRNPDLVGVPIAFHGGSRGFGHRALLMKPGHIRSTDMLNNRYAAGHTSTVTASTTSEALAIIEHAMGVIYTGVSKTIDGQLIPNFEQVTPKPPAKQTRGARVDQSLRRLRKSLALSKSPIRSRMLRAAIASLMKIPTHDVKS
jgi:hypothetical protein